MDIMQGEFFFISNIIKVILLYQMLDYAYRPALAQLINELSRETQFIVTSHCHDILDYGDQFYGVKNRDQVIRMCCSACIKTFNSFS
jgi:hypothetical protein